MITGYDLKHIMGICCVILVLVCGIGTGREDVNII